MRIPTVLRLLCCGGLLAGCQVASLEPRPMDPPSSVPRAAPLRQGVLAVLDLEDRRPDHERRDTVLSDTFLGGLVPEGAFWSLQGEDAEDLAAVRDEEGRRRALRFTGDRAWLWNPYPSAGNRTLQRRPANVGLSDLIAHMVHARGAVPRVLRVATLEEARALDATWVLGGSVQHFASLFEESLAPAPGAPETSRIFRITPWVGLELWLLEGGTELWKGSPATPVDADFQNLGDHFGSHRSLQDGDAVLLNPDRFPRLAFEDMTGAVQRQLDELLLQSLAGIEAALAPAQPD